MDPASNPNPGPFMKIHGLILTVASRCARSTDGPFEDIGCHHPMLQIAARLQKCMGEF
jgi:hypothetical protein